MATKNQIGRMNKRIALLEPVDSILPGGGGETEYVVLMETWAEVLPVKSHTELTDSQIEFQESLQFNFRFSIDGRAPTKRMQIAYRGKQYTINTIREIFEDKRFWQVTGNVNVEYTT